MTYSITNQRPVGIVFGEKSNEFLQNKTAFESSVKSSNLKTVNGGKLAVAFVVPLWITYIVGTACVTAGAYVANEILKDIGKILFGEPRTKGTLYKEGFIRQIMRSIEANANFSTLQNDMQSRIEETVKSRSVSNTNKDEAAEEKPLEQVQSSSAMPDGGMPPDDKEDQLRKKIKQLEENLQDLLAKRSRVKDRNLSKQIKAARTKLQGVKTQLDIFLGSKKYYDPSKEKIKKIVDLLRSEMNDPTGILLRGRGWF